MAEAGYTVTGMTCEHCVRSVSEEVGEISGVTGVSVDLPTGKVVISSDAELAENDVRAAVEDAGYQLSACERPEQGTDSDHGGRTGAKETNDDL